MTRASANRGDATTCIPKRSMSNIGLLAADNSKSQAEHPVEMTRMASDLEKIPRSWLAFCFAGAGLSKSSLVKPKVATDVSFFRVPDGQILMHSLQAMHAPRSTTTDLLEVISTAPVGHDSTQAVHSLTQGRSVTFGNPVTLASSATGIALLVTIPFFNRYVNKRNMHSPHRSCPLYERLKLLLHRGKSATTLLRTAIARAVQLFTLGSLIQYLRTFP